MWVRLWVRLLALPREMQSVRLWEQMWEQRTARLWAPWENRSEWRWAGLWARTMAPLMEMTLARMWVWQLVRV